MHALAEYTPVARLRVCIVVTAMAIAASFLITGCTTVTSADPRDAIVAALAGSWDNRAQFDAAPASLKVAPSVNGEWLDVQYARFTQVAAPAIGERVIYLEWKNGGPDGAISRQRIWSYRIDSAGVVRMDFYAFVDGKPWAGKADTPEAFRALTTEALRGYGTACALVFVPQQSGFRGVITANECTITAASGRRMGIDARIELLADGTLEYRESGRLDDGRYAFRVPTDRAYRFVKQR